MKALLITSVFLILLSASVMAGDEDKPDKDKPRVEAKIVVAKVKPVKRVIVILNSDSMNKILVVSTDGRWIHEARMVTIISAIGSHETSTVKCVMYKGLFKPTNPEIKTWELEAFIPTSSEDFQKILDGLQGGKFDLPEIK